MRSIILISFLAVLSISIYGQGKQINQLDIEATSVESGDYIVLDKQVTLGIYDTQKFDLSKLNKDSIFDNLTIEDTLFLGSDTLTKGRLGLQSYRVAAVNNTERAINPAIHASVLQLNIPSAQSTGIYRFDWTISVNPNSSLSGFVESEIRYSINSAPEVVINDLSTQDNFNWNCFSSFFELPLNDGDNITVNIYMRYLNVAADTKNTRIITYKVSEL